MPEKNYSKRELDHGFADIAKRLDKQDTMLTNIDTKVGIQNGRVTKIEIWTNEARKVIENNTNLIGEYKSDKIRVWTAYIVGGLLIGTIIFLSITAVDNKIQKGITKALSAYNIVVNN